MQIRAHRNGRMHDRRDARSMGLVQLEQLAVENLERPAVEDDVVVREQTTRGAIVEAHEEHAREGSYLEIDTALAILTERSFECHPLRLGSFAAPIHDVDDELRRAPHDEDGLG